jgi:Rieske 2Fe-2S family protein
MTERAWSSSGEHGMRADPRLNGRINLLKSKFIQTGLVLNDNLSNKQQDRDDSRVGADASLLSAPREMSRLRHCFDAIRQFGHDENKYSCDLVLWSPVVRLLPMLSNADVLSLLMSRRPWHTLPQPFYNDPDIYAADLEHIWYRDWIFVTTTAELPKRGSYATVQIGDSSIIVVRGNKGMIRAFHNSCRHRGSRICSKENGTAPKLVCPYHQWTYDLDGRLLWARDMDDRFDATQHGLVPVHCHTVQGMVYVSLANEAPDRGVFEDQANRYLAPHDLGNLKVAYQSRIIEKANWKLVLENNRECYHCSSNHPSLCLSFPDDPALNGADGKNSELLDKHTARCEAAGLPGGFTLADDEQWRFARVPLLDKATTFTLDGQPAVNRRVGTVPFDDAGVCLFFHFPNSWNHFLTDNVTSFRVLPRGPEETELVTTWLVHADTKEGVDYDLKRLTEVWIATNDEDRRITEENQIGVNSSGYIPGPYSKLHEAGVNQFVDWYCRFMQRQLVGPFARAAE